MKTPIVTICNCVGCPASSTKAEWNKELGILMITDMPSSMMISPTAISLGHVNIFASGRYKSANGEFAMNRFGTPIAEEESLHTKQAEVLGPAYIPLHTLSLTASVLTGGGTHDNNLLEQGPESGTGPWPWSTE